ncbi:MAG TPA: hypothetical protein VFW25_03410 [Silvibacterium sp.]|nr:hypothetical protein [Silvibacterium sp.]
MLDRLPVIRRACDLDLLNFLSRHPRALLTIDQLAAFVGYEMRQVAQSIDAFIEAGLLERTQNANHAARMYRLLLDSYGDGGLKALLALSSTRQGRGEVLNLLRPREPSTTVEHIQRKGRLHAIA